MLTDYRGTFRRPRYTGTVSRDHLKGRIWHEAIWCVVDTFRI